MRTFAVIVTVASALLACGGDEAPEAGEPVTPPAAEEPTTPTSAVLNDGTAWQLTQVENVTVMPDSSRARLIFDTSDHAGGNTGCNNLGGSYTQVGDSLRFGAMITTKMACEESVMQLETAFLGALEATRSFVRQSGELRLLAADGRVLARLTHADSTTVSR